MDYTESNQQVDPETLREFEPHVHAISDAVTILGNQLAYAVSLSMACGKQIIALNDLVAKMSKQLTDQQVLLDQILEFDPSNLGPITSTHPPFDNM